MGMLVEGLPGWLPAYWVGVTLLRVVLMAFVLYWLTQMQEQGSRPIPQRIAWISIIGLSAWAGAAIFLGSRNMFRIHEDVVLPPPIAAAAMLPILIGFLAFQYWEPFRRLIFRLPQHWLIALQVYRITGGVFLVIYGLDLVPGVFALTSGWGDLITGLLAIPVAYFCYKQTPWAKKTAVAWNYLGLVELIILIPFGLLSSPSPIQTLALEQPNLVTSTWPSVLAPTFHVPLGILLHIFSLAMLRGESPERVPATPRKIGWQLMVASSITIFAYAMLFYVLTPILTPRGFAYQVYPGLGEILQSHPWGLYIHIVPSMLALVLGPFQFHQGLRERHRSIHRAMGRTYLVSILIGGLGAFYIAQFSFAGIGSRLGFSVLAVLLLFTGYMAYTHIRRREIQTHREWMMRNYALIFAAVTLRIYIRTFFALGYNLPDFHALNAWLCWVPNLIFVEWLIRRGRSRLMTPQQVQTSGAAD